MNAYTRDLQVGVPPRFTADTTFEFETCYVGSQSPRPAPLLFSRGGSGNERVTEDCAKVMLVLDRSFAGQGHVTMSIIKIGCCTKWLQKLKEHDEISKTANFETAVTQAYAWDFMVVLSKCEKFKGFVWLGGKGLPPGHFVSPSILMIDMVTWPCPQKGLLCTRTRLYFTISRPLVCGSW